MTVEVIEYKHKKYGDRVGLRFPYNRSLVEAIKVRLPFPDRLWDNDEKLWSFRPEKKTMLIAAEALIDHGMDAEKVYQKANVQPVEQHNPNEIWVEAVGMRLKMNIPWINDAELRKEVLDAIRAVEGRKWDALSKTWSIPLGQAKYLYNNIRELYPELATTLANCDEVSGELYDSIRRVEMSGAAELTFDEVRNIDKKLESKLPPDLELYPFQKVGVAFAHASNGRCLIGDEMGVGKTIQAIGYAALTGVRPVVVVCPANVKYNWQSEIKRWLPVETVQVLDEGATPLIDADFYIISYDLLTKKLDELIRKRPRMSILDEAHYIKNSKTKRTKSTCTLARYTPKTVALSGTAITSRPKEFFNVLNILRPDNFVSEWDFLQRYCDPFHNGFGWNFDGASNVKELNERTRDVCIRRLKQEVLAELPDKVRQFIPVKLRPSDRHTYDAAQDEWEERINSYYLNGEPMPAGFMLNMLSDLRHRCGLLKVPFACEWVEEYRESTGKPLVVFAHHRDVIEAMSLPLSKNNRVAEITGSTPSQERQHIVDAFQKGEIDILLCSTTAAKEGLTLTKADTVLFIEREWLPTDEEQAEARIHRIGQNSNSVHSVYLSCINTIDEHFDRVVEQKRQVVKAVLDGGDVEQRKSLVKELVKRLKKERNWREINE